MCVSSSCAPSVCTKPPFYYPVPPNKIHEVFTQVLSAVDGGNDPNKTFGITYWGVEIELCNINHGKESCIDRELASLPCVLSNSDTSKAKKNAYELSWCTSYKCFGQWYWAMKHSLNEIKSSEKIALKRWPWVMHMGWPSYFEKYDALEKSQSCGDCPIRFQQKVVFRLMLESACIFVRGSPTY